LFVWNVLVVFSQGTKRTTNAFFGKAKETLAVPYCRNTTMAGTLQNMARGIGTMSQTGHSSWGKQCTKSQLEQTKEHFAKVLLLFRTTRNHYIKHACHVTCSIHPALLEGSESEIHTNYELKVNLEYFCVCPYQ
jgi:hypothetical protein